MTAPQMPALVKRYLDLKRDYLDLMSKLNTSYGHVSNINEGLYGSHVKTARTSLIEAEAHIALITANAQRVERYRRELLKLIDQGADKATAEWESAVWKDEYQERNAS